MMTFVFSIDPALQGYRGGPGVYEATSGPELEKTGDGGPGYLRAQEDSKVPLRPLAHGYNAHQHYQADGVMWSSGFILVNRNKHAQIKAEVSGDLTW